MTTIGRRAALDRLAGLVDVELHAVEFEQQIVGEFDVGLVDLVDQQHRPLARDESLPQLAAADVVADVGDARVAELRIAQARDGVVFVEPLLGAGRRLDVPGDQRRAERVGDLLGEQRLAGAGLALDQQRPLEADRRIDRGLQFVAGDIGRRALKTHRRLASRRRARRLPRSPALNSSRSSPSQSTA